jgi:predicted nuclease of predicted toxin-antitoxin system
MARLYANENFPREVVEILRSFGHDVLTLQETGHGEQAMTDEEVLTAAMQDNRAVITLDRRDFIGLHRSHPEHAGIIVCTQDADPSGQAGRIHDSISSIGELRGELIRVYRPHKTS